jgi:hypothetical protein
MAEPAMTTDVPIPLKIDSNHLTRRQFPRYRVTGRGRLSVDPGKSDLSVGLIDLSMSGASLRSGEAVPTDVPAQFAFAVLCTGIMVSVQVRVIVRYCVIESLSYRSGVEFVDPDAKNCAALERIVEARKRVVREH